MRPVRFPIRLPAKVADRELAPGRFSRRAEAQRRRVAGACPRFAFAVLLAFSLGGCSRMNGAPSAPPLSLTLQVSETALHPGDPLIVHAWVRNAGNRPLTIQMLDASSIEFYISGPGGAIKARPVVSRLEPLGLAENVPPGHALPERRARAFVFTTAANKPGQYHILGIYHPVPKGMESNLEPVISKSESFKVEGPPSVQRDRDGILLKENAIALAKRHANRPDAGAEALLLETDNGFLLWRVVLAADPKSASPVAPAQQVFYVNPYVAVVMATDKSAPQAKSTAKVQPKAVTAPPKKPDDSMRFEPTQILPPS